MDHFAVHFPVRPGDGRGTQPDVAPSLQNHCIRGPWQVAGWDQGKHSWNQQPVVCWAFVLSFSQLCLSALNVTLCRHHSEFMRPSRKIMKHIDLAWNCVAKPSIWLHWWYEFLAWLVTLCPRFSYGPRKCFALISELPALPIFQHEIALHLDQTAICTPRKCGAKDCCKVPNRGIAWLNHEKHHLSNVHKLYVFRKHPYRIIIYLSVCLSVCLYIYAYLFSCSTISNSMPDILR